MRNTCRLLFTATVAALALVTMAVNCNPLPEMLVDATYNVDSDGDQITFQTESASAWSAAVNGGRDWCSVSPSSGKDGTVNFVITVLPNPNFKGRTCTINLKFGNDYGRVTINQAQKNRLTVQPDLFEIDAEGGPLAVEVTTNIEYEVAISDQWLTWDDGVINVTENAEEEGREATVTLFGSGLECVVTVRQASYGQPMDPLDGVVELLYAHTLGAGIPIVIMGDAFSHDEIADFSYRTVMADAAEIFFSEEPYATFREMFDVYVVNVVSAYYEDFTSGTSTTLGTWFGNDSYVNGDLDKCQEYAKRAVSEQDLDRTVVIVLLNRNVHAGQCYLNLNSDCDGNNDDGACGVAVAFAALGTDHDDFAGLVRHEAAGHGFGKLADEYSYAGYGAIPESTAEFYRQLQQRCHAYLNIDFTDDLETILWNRFIADERYQYDGLGAFPGGDTYESGIWHPSKESIMNFYTGGFNAPSREAIYWRIHKLAYGCEWEYNYETFAQYDAINRTQGPEENHEPEPEPEPEPDI